MPYITSVEQIGYDRGIAEELKRSQERLLEAQRLSQEQLLEAQRLSQERLLEAQRSLLIRQLTRKIGPIPTNTIDRINILQIDQLESLGETLFDFESIADLDNWLQT